MRKELGLLYLALLLPLVVYCDHRPGEPVSQPDFTVSAVPERDAHTAYVGGSFTIYLEVQRGSGAPLPQYFTFESSVKAKLRYAAKTYEENESIPIERTTSRLEVQLLAEEASQKAVIHFLFKGEGAQHELKVPLTLAIKASPFRLTVLSDPNQSVQIHQQAVVKVQIQGQSPYQPHGFRFYTDMGGTLTYAGGTYEPGALISISPGTKTIEALFKPDKAGQDLRLSFVAETFVPQEVRIPLTAHYPSFAVDIVSQLYRGAMYVKQKNKIGFRIKPEPGTVLTHFSFHSNRRGKLLYKGHSYEMDSPIPIGQETYVAVEYQPDAIGETTLGFRFFDSFGQSEEVSATPLSVKPLPFELFMHPSDTRPIEKEKFRNIPMSLLVWPEHLVPGIFYTWWYSVSPPGAGVIRGVKPGEANPIPPRTSHKYEYLPQLGFRGEHTLSFVISDGYEKRFRDIVFQLPVLPTLPEEGLSVFYREMRGEVHFFARIKKVQKGTYPISFVEMTIPACKRGTDPLVDFQEYDEREKDGTLAFHRSFTASDYSCSLEGATVELELIDEHGNSSPKVRVKLQKN